MAPESLHPGSGASAKPSFTRSTHFRRRKRGSISMRLSAESACFLQPKPRVSACLKRFPAPTHKQRLAFCNMSVAHSKGQMTAATLLLSLISGIFSASPVQLHVNEPGPASIAMLEAEPRRTRSSFSRCRSLKQSELGADHQSRSQSLRTTPGNDQETTASGETVP